MQTAQIAFDSMKTFDQLLPFAEQAEPQCSFWGGRYLTIKDYDGFLPLDALTKRVLELVTQNERAPIPPPYALNQNHLLMVNGQIRYHIDHIYEESDEQVRTANCFTRLLAYIRYFRIRIGNITPLRWAWIEDEKRQNMPLKNAICAHEIRPNDMARLKRFLAEPAEQSFWRQLYDDYLWYRALFNC